MYAVLEDFRVYVLLQAGEVVLDDDAGTSMMPLCEHDPAPLAGRRMVTLCVCGLVRLCMRDNDTGELQVRARTRAEYSQSCPLDKEPSPLCANTTQCVCSQDDKADIVVLHMPSNSPNNCSSTA